MVVTNEKKAAKLQANRVKRNSKYEASMNEGWRRVRKQEEAYSIPPVLIEQPYSIDDSKRDNNEISNLDQIYP